MREGGGRGEREGEKKWEGGKERGSGRKGGGMDEEKERGE